MCLGDVHHRLVTVASAVGDDLEHPARRHDREAVLIAATGYVVALGTADRRRSGERSSVEHRVRLRERCGDLRLHVWKRTAICLSHCTGRLTRFGADPHIEFGSSGGRLAGEAGEAGEAGGTGPGTTSVGREAGPDTP
jgi:hypothetical protein